MESAREITLSILEDLINTCIMEHILFKTASGKITSPSIKTTLDHCVDEKNSQINKLKNEVTRLGGKFEEKDFQISQNILEEFDSFISDKEILTKCEKIDDIVLKKYSKAMDGNILSEVIPLVAKQYFATVSLHCKIMCFKSDLPTVYS
jgi:uncharacterized protein (TIGR02284 family)